jgi:hypothetical protein
MIVSRSDVAAATAAGTVAAAGGGAGPSDGYRDRVAKYIPGEVVVLYLGLVGLAASLPGGATNTVLLICFAIGVLATPVYLLAKFRREKVQLGLRLKVAQVLIATVAFVLWAWVLADPVKAPVPRSVGRFCLPVFTFLVGLYEP